MPDVAGLHYQRPPVYPKQQLAIFCPERFAVVEASTKSGKTVGCIIWLCEQALQGQAGRNYWWVAPTEKQARMAFDRLQRALDRRVFHPVQSPHPRIDLANGTRIWFNTAEKPDNLYGEDVFAVVIDEASRCRADAWMAVLSTLTATGGAARIIGNVRGRKNWAYELARRAEQGLAGWHYARLTADDAIEGGVMPPDAVAIARDAGLSEAAIRELFYAEPSDDEGNPFGLEAIRAAVAPLSGKKPVVWGWDLAKAHDWVVGIGLDEDGVTCRFERWNAQQLPPGAKGTYWDFTVTRIRDLVGELPAVIDATGLGDPVFERLAKHRPRMESYKFNPRSKQQLMEGLAVAIQQGLVRFPAGVIQAELEVFEYQLTRTGVKYSAPPGLHDDCVCALALAATKTLRPRVPLQMFGGFDHTADLEAEGASVYARAVQDVDEAILHDGMFWPMSR